jgi:hypothetical protein
MERTVTVPLDEYNALIKIQAMSELPRKHTVRIHQSLYYGNIVETDDEVVNKLAEELKDITKKNENLKAVLDSVKKMSCHEFRQWKKNL